MEMRRLQEMGGGTALVSLPKKWVSHNRLKKGSLVAMEVLPNSYLLLYPAKQEAQEVKQIAIPYPPRYIELVVNDITGAYLTGYDVIHIHGEKRISIEDRNKIKKAVRNLVGLEIVEEDASSITAQFLLELSTLTPEKIFRRMHVIARGMYRDAIDALVEEDRTHAKAVVERDEEIDRLYFLMVRLLRSAVQDLQLCSRYNLTLVDCLDYRVAANLIESIGDASVSLAEGVGNLNGPLPEKTIASFKHLGERLDEMQDKALLSFLNKNSSENRLIVSWYHEIEGTIEGLTKDAMNLSGLLGNTMLPIGASISKISRCCVDIADLAGTIYPNLR